MTLESSDDGVTWGNMMDISVMVSRPEWDYVGMGPGGIQLPTGRLIMCMSGGGGRIDDRNSIIKILYTQQ